MRKVGEEGERRKQTDLCGVIPLPNDGERGGSPARSISSSAEEREGKKGKKKKGAATFGDRGGSTNLLLSLQSRGKEEGGKKGKKSSNLVGVLGVRRGKRRSIICDLSSIL